MQGQSQRGGLRGGRRGFGGPSRGGDGQGRSRRGTTTTPQAVANMRANIANRRGTKYSDSLRDAITRSNEEARSRSLAARKAKAAQEAIQAAEAKQVSPTASGIEGMVSRMDEERGGLRDLARRNRITNTQLNRLGALNEAIGLNRTTGMGPIESLRNTFSRPEFKQGIAKLASNYSKISPLGIIMRNILNPQYEEQTGIQSLPDFQNLQRTNQMFSPGVYDFTQPTRMPMQFAEVTAPDLRAINFGRSQGLGEVEMPRSQFPLMTDDEYRGVMDNIITEPGEYEMRDGTLQPVEKGGLFGSLFG